MKTIKQIADEIGVSKDKVKYQVGKLPSNYLVKVGKITHLTDPGVGKIKEILVGKVVGNSPGKNREIPHFLPEEENQLYKILSVELEVKNNQIATLQEELTTERIHSREQANKIADLANQLAELNRNNQILLGSEQSRTNPALLPKGDDNQQPVIEQREGFFKRVFGKRKEQKRNENATY